MNSRYESNKKTSNWIKSYNMESNNIKYYETLKCILFSVYIDNTGMEL